MKKRISLLLAVALLMHGSGINAISWIRKNVGSPLQSFLSRYVGQPTARSASNFMNWAGPFFSDLNQAYQKGELNRLPGILEQYKSQSAAAGVAATVVLVILGFIIKALVGRSSRARGNETDSHDPILDQRYGLDKKPTGPIRSKY